ncbi:MAG: methionine--tRNA ligase [Candidatus Komeilibacteria bacterium]
MSERFYITTPIYYVNDRPHLGHAYTTLLADVAARYFRGKLGADKVWFLTGTDEHGAKVLQKAEEQGMAVEQFVDQVAAEFQQTWKKLDIANDDFIRTTEPRHIEAVGKIMARLRAAVTPAGQDTLYQGEYEGLYCVGCEKFLTEKDLVDGKCPLHPSETPQLLKEKNWFFRLQDWLPQLEQLIVSDQLKIIPETRKNEVLGLLQQKLPDFSVSRQNVKWGIPVPWDPEQVIYVWIEALMNYLTAIGYPTDDKRFQTWWPASAQLLGPEIIKFHAIYWPALLLALKLPLPQELWVHGFFTIDGQKMSKSIGNVIDPNTLVDRFGSDASRYLILSQFSFGSESDIKVSDFVERYNGELANGLGNFIARVTNLAEKYLPAGREIAEFVTPAAAQIDQAMATARFKEALQLIWQIVREGDQLIEQEKPWELAKSDPDRLCQVLIELLGRVKCVGRLIAPVMPQTAAVINSIFQGPKISKPTNLFNRLS